MATDIACNLSTQSDFYVPKFFETSKFSEDLEELLKSIAPQSKVTLSKESTDFHTAYNSSFSLEDTLNFFEHPVLTSTAPEDVLGPKLLKNGSNKKSSFGLESLFNSVNNFDNFTRTRPFNQTYVLEDQIQQQSTILDDFNSMMTKNVEQCAFCKRNGSPFFNHPLKDNAGGTVCPVLSQFTCKMCAATGREAHTHKYCKNNPYTRGDPVAVGMAPGPSVKNPRKSPATIDPSIDLEDIYGIRKYTSHRNSTCALKKNINDYCRRTNGYANQLSNRSINSYGYYPYSINKRSERVSYSNYNGRLANQHDRCSEGANCPLGRDSLKKFSTKWKGPRSYKRERKYRYSDNF